MPERQPTTDRADLWRRLSRWSQAAPWSLEELQDDLRQGGVDPDRLVDRLLPDVKRLLDAGSPQTPKPLLGLLQALTGRPPGAIAQALDVPVTFLAAVSRFPHAVPESWRQELASRAARALDVEPHRVLDALSQPFDFPVAAFRDAPYTADVQGFEDLLRRSGMSPEAQCVWRALASESAP